MDLAFTRCIYIGILVVTGITLWKWISSLTLSVSFVLYNWVASEHVIWISLAWNSMGICASTANTDTVCATRIELLWNPYSPKHIWCVPSPQHHLFQSTNSHILRCTTNCRESQKDHLLTVQTVLIAIFIMLWYHKAESKLNTKKKRPWAGKTKIQNNTKKIWVYFIFKSW